MGILFCINQCKEVHNSDTVTTSYTSEEAITEQLEPEQTEDAT